MGSRSGGRTDYTLRVKSTPIAHPVAVAILEAKDEDKHPTYGLDQAKAYQAKAKRLNVPFVTATNGHQWEHRRMNDRLRVRSWIRAVAVRRRA